MPVTSDNEGSIVALVDTVGFSMWPFLREAAMVLVREVAAGRLRVGDVIVYRGGSGLVCHRVVGFRNGCVLSRGDAAWGAPETVENSAILGKVVGIVGPGGVRGVDGPLQRFIHRLIVVVAPVIAWVSRVMRKVPGGR